MSMMVMKMVVVVVVVEMIINCEEEVSKRPLSYWQEHSMSGEIKLIEQ